MNWRKIPFLRLTIPFALGIAAACGSSLPQFLPGYIPGALAGILFLLSRLDRYRWRWAFGVFLFVTLFLLGYQRTCLHHEWNDPAHFRRHLAATNWIAGSVSEILNDQQNIRLRLRVKAIRDSCGRWKPGEGQVLLLLESDSTDRISYGSELLIRAHIRPISEPANPRAFSFRKYYHYQNIHYQAYVTKDNWRKLRTNKGPWLRRYFAIRRLAFIQVLKQHLKDEESFAVAAALLLGYKNELDRDTKEAYAKTGAIHILAVSGMHVGLLLFIIHFLLGLVPLGNRFWHLIKTLLTLSALWAYALITGAAPSVIRAVFMFSLLFVAISLKRSSNTYNAIFASAFCLLLYNPFYLMQLSFQLSYLAVLGIICFFPLIHRCLYFQTKVAGYLWSLSAVAMAAQLSTFPLSLYYFHQFPTYFLISGWVAVPMAPVLLATGFLLLLSSGWIWLSIPLGQILCTLLQGLNSCIHAIEQWPGSAIEQLWMSKPVMVLCYLLLLYLAWGWQRQNLKWITPALGMVALITVYGSGNRIQRLSQQELVLYHIPGSGLVDFFDGGKVITLREVRLSEKKEAFAAKNYRCYARSRSAASISFDTSGVILDQFYYQRPFLQFRHFRMAIIEGPFLMAGEKKITLHSVLLRHEPDIDLPVLQRHFDFHQILLDGSNGMTYVKSMEQSCRKAGLLFHSTGLSGAYIQKL